MIDETHFMPFYEAKYVLVKFSDEYADEFEVYGFSAMRGSAVQNLIRTAQKLRNRTFYFGTNECLYYATPDDFLKRISLTAITETEMQTLRDLFACEWGISVWDILEPFEEE